MLGRVTLVAAAAALAACSGAARGTQRTRMTTKEIVVKYKPGIVRVMSPIGIGTGFFVSKDGRIVTNLHVIAGATQLKVMLADDSEMEVTRVVAVDRMHDLAIIAVAAKAKVPTLRLGDSDEVEAGDRVIAIGNPLGILDYTVSDGLISSVRAVALGKVLQISAPISVGSSGGPLFNTYGEVIGIATFIASDGQNLNFGMPSNYIKPLLSQEGGMSVADFAAKMQDEETDLARRLRDPNAKGSDDAQPKIERKVPVHETKVLDGCSEDVLVELYHAIGKAIEVGAPVYNSGEHGACYRIYRRVVEAYESDQRMCKGLREALGQGLLRADGFDEQDFTSRAWAMRDTFDGVLDVIRRKATGQN